MTKKYPENQKNIAIVKTVVIAYFSTLLTQLLCVTYL